jgi:hypothetical protein
MTMTKHFRPGRLLAAGLCIWGSLLLAGCGGIKRVPVEGRVMLGGEPLKGGAVCFAPDAAKGNDARVVTCMGRVGPDGKYKLATIAGQASQTGHGAPTGWYKVWIMTDVPGQSKPIVVDKQYTSVDTTPLSVEVVESPAPGAYDFTLTK